MKVDLAPIKHKLVTVRGADGKDYYRVDFQILATYHSAHVEYKWQFQGKPSSFFSLSPGVLTCGR